MQSSPPLPYRHNDGQQSPEPSHYSLDLNALTMDDSRPSSPLPTAHSDQVRSEDIEGPSDFTVNMEAWMRGTPQRDGAKASKDARRIAGRQTLKTPEIPIASTGDQDAQPQRNNVEPGVEAAHIDSAEKDQKSHLPVLDMPEDAAAQQPESTASSPVRDNHLLQPTVEDLSLIHI